MSPDAALFTLTDADPRDLEVIRLAELPAVDYRAERKEAAKALKIGVGALDALIATERARKAAQRAQRERLKPPPGEGETRWPNGFTMKLDGLYFDAGKDAPPVWICQPFDVLGEARDAQGEGWSQYIRFLDGDKREHAFAVSQRLLFTKPGELEAELADRGLRISSFANARNHLRTALIGVQSGNRVTLVQRPGWHRPVNGPASYVLADGTEIGRFGEQLVLRASSENAALMCAQAGTMDGWKAGAATLADGNPIAMFMLCGGFAGPLIDVLNESSGGVHLVGKSKSGKTLAVKLAASIWGEPHKKGLLRDWRATANGLEAAAEESNDGLLVLDEIHQANPAEVIGAVYMLANGGGKTRMRADATQKARKQWQAFVQSTGEFDLASMAAKAGQRLTAGADVRLPSIHIPDAGIWQKLHGHADARKLMAAMQAALKEHHGHAGRAFVERLVTARTTDAGADALRQTAETIRNTFSSLLPGDADMQLFDVARRFALVAISGELAIRWGFLPWKKESATTAALDVFKLWRGQRGGDGSSEERQQIEAIRTFLIQHGASRFTKLVRDVDDKRWIEADSDRTVFNRAGWRRSHIGGRNEFLIPPESWRQVCADAGVDPNATANTLRVHGFIEPKDGPHQARQQRIPNTDKPKIRPFVIHSALIGNYADTDGDTQ